MFVSIVAIVAIAAVLAAVLLVRHLRAGSGGLPPSPESLLLEEMTVVEPVAPGMEGKAEIRKRGAGPATLRVRATDDSQAFVRGAKVRVIDFRDGCCYVESADEVHLVH
jgi:membrane protein implicated in regulation of membrane protease activity